MKRRRRLGRSSGESPFYPFRLQVREGASWRTVYRLALRRQVNALWSELASGFPRSEKRAVDAGTGVVLRYDPGASGVE